MRPTVTNRVYSVVCRSDTVVIPAKTVEPIETPMGFRTLVGPRNHACIRWVFRSPRGEEPLRGAKGWPIAKNSGTLRCAVQKMADPIEILWVVSSDTPNESCNRSGSRSPPSEGAILMVKSVSLWSPYVIWQTIYIYGRPM